MISFYAPPTTIAVNTGVTLVNLQPQAQKSEKLNTLKKVLHFSTKKIYFLYSGVTAHQAVKQKNSYTPDDYWLYLE